MLIIFCLTILSSALIGCWSASVQDWKQRTIYQLLTDRFAKTVDTTQNCSNLHDYCNGTFHGIMNHLDYIQGMKFDAIWISPVVTNVPKVYIVIILYCISLHKYYNYPCTKNKQKY